MATTEQSLTLEEFLELPEKEPALEYEYGEVTQKVPPQLNHAILQARLAGLLNNFAVPSCLAMAVTELRTTYGGFSRLPDVAVYRWERIPVDAEGWVVDGALTAPPDIAIEIVSPDQRVSAQLRRCVEYVNAGAVIALLVDPDDHSVVIVRPDRPVQTARGDERIDLDDVLPGFELTAQQLFDTLRLR
jgi:Uma2 family endonuclease